jgi:hypothetical protein
MPSLELLSAGVFICEKVLREIDGVASAVRIVDIFYAEDPLPDLPVDVKFGQLVQAHAFISLKAKPTGLAYPVVVRLEAPDGETKDLDPLSVEFSSTPGLDAPTGASIDVQLNIATQTLGTWMLRVLLDGKEVARAPFSILKRAQLPQSIG